jgi:hypothetical protein
MTPTWRDHHPITLHEGHAERLRGPDGWRAPGGRICRKIVRGDPGWHAGAAGANLHRALRHVKRLVEVMAGIDRRRPPPSQGTGGVLNEIKASNIFKMLAQPAPLTIRTGCRCRESPLGAAGFGIMNRLQSLYHVPPLRSPGSSQQAPAHSHRHGQMKQQYKTAHRGFRFRTHRYPLYAGQH